MDELKNIIQEKFKQLGCGHDYYHLERVSRLALHIGKLEHANLEVLEIAALLHDLHRLMEHEQKRTVHPSESLPLAKEMLEQAKIPQHLHKQILHCIDHHDDFAFEKNARIVTDVETLVLQDADRIDAIGAIGIARVFAFGATRGQPIWDPQIADISPELYDGNDPTSMHHIKSRMLKLNAHMNTKTGKKIAKERHDFVINFLKQFEKEWNGEL